MTLCSSVLAILLSLTVINNCSTEENTDIMSKRVAPVISKAEEFEQKLPGFLSANKTLCVLLDYDGTLAPLCDNPANTVMDPELEKNLHLLAENPKVFMAVISGRGLKDVEGKVGIKNITYAGNHGIEIQSPDGSRQDYQLPEDVQKSYRSLVDELNKKLNKNGAWVEDKKVSLTYHYRDTASDLIEAQRKEAVEIIKRHGFSANQAHAAIEAKPPVNWNKGEAALLILKNNFGNDWKSKTSVVFAGDDTTDEDAMRALQGIGKSFRVATDPKIETYADFRLPKQELVHDLIRWLCQSSC
ncbi:uncharacterized protein LOC129920587 [Episyrphus balteatus]|uniref:uncharacterized protein LOC129920587 n=1 Tax=Episyrphus balteatus TaxID=286459 RepID=UPI0024864FFA|nr:uncharacterized protein LOC129920587 [Episyrphus balteatus]